MRKTERGSCAASQRSGVADGTGLRASVFLTTITVAENISDFGSCGIALIDPWVHRTEV
ncbi:MAG: hypothetical protein JNL62_21005 [Bryobacterales bacterium]|nr:hypothetical protein [Bryobacterales bacterium]